MSRDDDIFDVGKQHESHEGGMWVNPNTCVTCGDPATMGSWCEWDHPGNDAVAKALEEFKQRMNERGDRG